MKKTILLLNALLLLACAAFNASAQTAEQHPAKLIAVVNRAAWCAVCKANGQRFGATLMPYAAKGVTIIMNDLTDPETTAASARALRDAGVYDAVNTVHRKGMGRMMQSCGLVKGKHGANATTGIVTFVDPLTHRQLKQLSIATPDADMQRAIDHLLAKAE